MIYEKHFLREGREDVCLTTYIGTHSKEFLGKRKRPAILICPGGAYLTCSEGEGEPVALAFNNMGYHAFVLNYSTYMEGRPGIPMGRELPAAKECCQFPNPMFDIQAAMEHIIANAEDWCVDTEEIFLCGFSAGAHNVGMYSVYWKEYGMPKPAGTILGYPLADYREVYNDPMQPLVRLAYGGKPEWEEEMYVKTSILDHVSKDTPPMYIWTTATDEQLPCRNSMLLGMKLTECEIPFELHVFETGNHGMSLASYSSAIMEGQVRADLHQWVPMCETWLRRRTRIDLLDKMPF